MTMRALLATGILLAAACAFEKDRFQLGMAPDGDLTDLDADPTRDGGDDGPDPRPDAPACPPPERVSCPATGHTVDEGSTLDPGATALTEAYACSDWDESGPESTYVFTPDVSGEVTVGLTDLAAGIDLDVFVLEAGCPAEDCLAFGDATATFTAEAGVTYHLVVDGYEGAAGVYTLELHCP